jgi:hypothetical protein
VRKTAEFAAIAGSTTRETTPILAAFFTLPV